MGQPMENAKLDKIISLLEQLIAIQLHHGGASQQAIAKNLGFSIGKINGLVKGMKSRKDSHDEGK
jgi:transposase